MMGFLKQFRRVTMGDDEPAKSFLSFVQRAATHRWMRVVRTAQWIGRYGTALFAIPIDLRACASGACAQEYPSAASGLTVSGSTLSAPAATPGGNMSGAPKSCG